MAKSVQKKRNPNDATFRNITALKARVALLEDRLEALHVFSASHARILERLLDAVPSAGVK